MVRIVIRVKDGMKLLRKGLRVDIRIESGS